jgi:hypothetical protein
VNDRIGVLEARGFELVGHSDLDGRGDGMQIMRDRDVLYVGHMGDFGVGTSVVDISDPTLPHVVSQTTVPHHTHAHKTQLADGLLLVNNERYPYQVRDPASAGIRIYDVTRPRQPREIGFLAVDGLGVHRIWYAGGRFAYASAQLAGYRRYVPVTIDMADPSRPKLHSVWAWPGEQDRAGVEHDATDAVRDVSCHHPIIRGDRAYAGYFDAGVAIFAVKDGQLDLLGSTAWTERVGGHPHTHTALPLGDRKLLAVTDEAIEPDCAGARKDIHLVEISDERHPREIAVFPVPSGDYCARGLRFGPHNLHENRPGSFTSDTIVFATYFNAGLRAYDTSDPHEIREIGCFVPTPPPGQKAIQLNDVLVSEDGLVFVTDRIRGGLYVLRWSGRSS